MGNTFDDYLAGMRGKIRKIDIFDQFESRRSISMYYWNKASDLHSGALVIWNAYGTPETSIDPETLGLGQGFLFQVSLPPCLDCWLVSQLNSS